MFSEIKNKKKEQLVKALMLQQQLLVLAKKNHLKNLIKKEIEKTINIK